MWDWIEAEGDKYPDGETLFMPQMRKVIAFCSGWGGRLNSYLVDPAPLLPWQLMFVAKILICFSKSFSGRFHSQKL